MKDVVFGGMIFMLQRVVEVFVSLVEEGKDGMFNVQLNMCNSC